MFIDYFRPMPLRGPLSRDAWGVPTVGPRDVRNGLEDATMRHWCYWDGAVIRADDGRYHMFASRWDERAGHDGWRESVVIHAVADHVMGPYEDEGICWPHDQGGKGHNATLLVMPDGRYAITVSETRPGEVFASASLDGPWASIGRIAVAHQPGWQASNVTPILRQDGRYMIVQRSGHIMVGDAIVGPYVAQGPSIYAGIDGLPRVDLEDPVAWHSGGLYHLVVNGYMTRKAFHLTSPDGISDWTFRGLAYDPTVDFVRYTDGTVNRWDKIERPFIIMEDGHVAYFILSVLDVPKEEERGDDQHGSKVIIVPFDGRSMDRDMAATIESER